MRADESGPVSARKPRNGRRGRPPGKTPRREMLIDAAVNLFLTHGYRQTSTAMIGAAAGISGPAVYRHFAGKEDLLKAALELSAGQLLDAASEAEALEPGDGVDRLLERLADLNVLRSGWFVLWMEERRNLSSDLRDLIGGMHQQYIHRFAEMLVRARPGLTVKDALVLGQAALGVMTSVTYLHLDPRHPDQIESEGFRRMLVAICHRMLFETPLDEVRAAAQLGAAVVR